jgi:hypothetical protein
MDPGKRNARGGDPGAAIAATAKSQDHQEGSRPGRVSAVRAAAFGPCRGRTMWSYAVRCSRCGGTHLHRGGPPREDGHLRTAPCGLTYRVLARTVLPALEVVA